MSEPTVLIESLIKREGGSKIPMGDKLYHFRPDDAGRHVATVSDTDHIARFLQISEGFRLLGAIAAPVAPVPAVPVGVITGEGGSGAAPTASEPTPAPVVVTPEPAPTPAPATDAKPLNQMTDEEVRAVFKAELGRVAPPKSKIETMIAQIEAVRAERGAAQ